ncbi:hypothetical protein [Curtobacterium aetherium]|uniref:Uncharacterized protein n=1 Tax=Curtobacterium aetherium TaxID=2841594 RepID=A0ACD1E5Q6_9MICO|nr:hypothetical protein [Curtobacterium sp. L6-1]QWS34287.1 hypothetical protein KM842_03665 [Curtobacterium sp. L6-1]
MLVGTSDRGGAAGRRQVDVELGRGVHDRHPAAVPDLATDEDGGAVGRGTGTVLAIAIAVAVAGSRLARTAAGALADREAGVDRVDRRDRDDRLGAGSAAVAALAGVGPRRDRRGDRRRRDVRAADVRDPDGHLGLGELGGQVDREGAVRAHPGGPLVVTARHLGEQPPAGGRLVDRPVQGEAGRGLIDVADGGGVRQRQDHLERRRRDPVAVPPGDRVERPRRDGRQVERRGHLARRRRLTHVEEGRAGRPVDHGEAVERRPGGGEVGTVVRGGKERQTVDRAGRRTAHGGHGQRTLRTVLALGQGDARRHRPHGAVVVEVHADRPP